MTKKLLALALAGTTAFSVFGGVNVFAVDAYQDDYDTAVAVGTIDETTYDTTAKLKAFAEKLVTEKPAVGEDVSKTDIYLYNYKLKDSDKVTELEGVISDILGLGDAFDSTTATVPTWDDNANAAADYLKGAIDAAFVTTDFEKGYSTATGSATSSARSSIYTAFIAFQKDIKDNFDAGAYETGSGSAYVTTNFAALITDILAATDQMPTSYYVHLQNEYDRLIGELDSADTSSAEEKYYEKLDEVNNLVEDDYSTANWLRVQAYIAEAEAKAEDATTPAKWTEAKEILDKIDTVQTKTPEWDNLKELMLSLYVDGKTSSIAQGIYADDGTHKDYDDDDSVYTYIATDYKVKTGVYTDAWYDFAGYLNDKEDDDYVEGAYRKAAAVYKRVASSSTRKYVGQSVVDEAVAELESAIDALEGTSSTSNWRLVRLEDTVEEAEGLVETDYNTSKSAWKKFVTALEAAQDVLAESNPTNRKLDNAWSDLDTAMKALSGAQKAVPTATKNELKDLIKEAKELLKDVDGKNSSQIIALTDAKEDGEDVTADNSAKISDYENAIEALEAAIAGFSQTQGWYTNADGKWMYGEGDSYVTSGWKKIKNAWYYFNADGTAKQNEWFKDGNDWFWMTNNCNAAHGWAKVNGEWYFFRDGGYMVTGWRLVNGLWYYMDGSGKMLTGWVNVGGKYYYLSKASSNYGAMLANTTTPDGYKVGADGAWIK